MNKPIEMKRLNPYDKDCRLCPNGCGTVLLKSERFCVKCMKVVPAEQPVTESVQ